MGQRWKAKYHTKEVTRIKAQPLKSKEVLANNFHACFFFFFFFFLSCFLHIPKIGLLLLFLSCTLIQNKQTGNHNLLFLALVAKALIEKTASGKK